MPSLKIFDGITGNDTLRKLKVIIHTGKNCMTLGNGKKIGIYSFLPQQSISSPHQKANMNAITKKFSTLFMEPNEKLTYTTGGIRTTSNTPVYTKSYPYPTSLRSEVEKQVTALINDGIIRPSRSPYNSPV